MTPKNDFLNNSLWLCRSVFGPQSTDVTGELVGNAEYQASGVLFVVFFKNCTEV